MVGKHVFSGIKWVHSSYFSGISVGLPSGKHTKNYGKIHHFQWEDPLLIAIFNGYVSLPEGN